MAEVIVTVTPKGGGAPRGFRIADDASDRGLSAIATFRRRQLRGELESVVVEAVPQMADVPVRPAKKAAAKAEPPAEA